ncbi:MAG: 3-dehydroquinate synthase [Treponema sp.]|nr:3-dehydroquinate synthase [Treponema sp.]
MKKITVKASKIYDITIGAGILDQAGLIMSQTAGISCNAVRTGKTAAVITDDNVSRLYEKRLVDSLSANGYRAVSYVFPNGESSKNTGTFISILNFLAEKQLSRADIVVALGGGVTGDLAGFAAACYLRGIHFVQIPTTLLSIVDSSVGGKTAVNLASGKNLAGAFYQPDAVICDVTLLSTLSDDVFRDGCAEIIKTGVIADRVLFESLKEPVKNHLEEVIIRCIEIKRDVVAEDEFETGVRKFLNFGHTAGHAIELLSGYLISHGHAVAAGMAIAARMAVVLGICDTNCLKDILQMLQLYGLPENSVYSAGDIARVCLSDKKREGDSITMILPVETGKCVLRNIPVNDLEKVIQSGLEITL